MGPHRRKSLELREEKEGVKTIPSLGITFPERFRGVTDSREVVARFIRQTYGTQRHALKLVAADAGVGVQTAKSWADGKTEPNLGTFLKWAQAVPELRAEVARILALDAALDPRVPRLLSELHSLVIRGLK